jgi:hypothetical protein
LAHLTGLPKKLDMVPGVSGLRMVVEKERD